MYLNLTKNQFPEHLAKIIIENKESIYDINLVLHEDTNDVLNTSSLDKIMVSIDSIPQKITLSLSDLEKLNIDSVKTLLGNSSFIKQLSKESFLALIISSDEAAEFALNNEVIKNKLNNLEPNLYQRLDILPQTFPHSCSACVILKILIENNLLNKEEQTRVKELEIYKDIWVSPGFIADPKKMIDYFCKYNLLVIGFEAGERSIDWLKKENFTSESTFSIANAGYSFFKQLTKNNFIEIKPGELIDESLFSENTSLLVHYVNNPQNNTHLLLGKRNSRGEFEVIDPKNGDVKTYNSFNEFYTLDEDFMGISFNVKL